MLKPRALTRYRSGSRQWQKVTSRLNICFIVAVYFTSIESLRKKIFAYLKDKVRKRWRDTETWRSSIC